MDQDVDRDMDQEVDWDMVRGITAAHTLGM